MSFQRLQKQITKLRKLDDWGSPILKKWKEDVTESIKIEFGAKSRQVEQFKRLDFMGPLFLREQGRNYLQEALSQAETILEVFEEELSESTEWRGFWEDIHPQIRIVSKNRYYSKSYADSVEAALKELNSKIKQVVLERTGNEFDGADLMNRAFSANDPIIKLEELATESQKSIQKGYQLIFAGTMTGIRNPKAHQNLYIDAKRARHHIYLASLLAQIVDEEYEPNKAVLTTPEAEPPTS